MSNPLSHKLYNFEELPPAKNWDAIAASLDQPSYADRLANFGQAPDAGVWDRIEQQIHNEPGNARVVPFFKRFSTGAKYAAAAAILILLTTAITFFVNGSGSADEMARQTPPGPTTEKAETTTQQEQIPLLPKEQQPEQSNKAQSSTQAPQTAQLKERKIKTARYITVADEEGKKVRLSKKAYTVFNCAENSAAANNERCKENIQLMQQKMAVSLSPSGDFGGLIDMLKTLEEN